MNVKIKLLLLTGLLKFTGEGGTHRNRWVFSSVDNSGFSYNSKYLFLYVKENMPQIEPVFVINDEKKRQELSEQYGEVFFTDTLTWKGAKRVWEAGVWFTSAGLPLYGTDLGKGHRIINLWHGIPLKKIALMENGASGKKRWIFKKLFSDNYRYILTESERLVPVMAESFAVPEGKIKVWGQPRNDWLFQHMDRQRLRDCLDYLPAYEKAVLYAPTYREYGATKLFPFSDFNRDELEEYLEKNKMILLLRTHISELGRVDFPESERIRYFNEDVVSDCMEYLAAFDLLITDYSSIYIDYLHLNRPIIFLPYDYDCYMRKRGMNFEYEQVTPGFKPENVHEFYAALEDGFGTDTWKETRDTIGRMFHEASYPCCKKICDYVLGGR